MEVQIPSCDLRRNKWKQSCSITGLMLLVIFFLRSCLISVEAAPAVTGTCWTTLKVKSKEESTNLLRGWKQTTISHRTETHSFSLNLTLAGAGAGAGAAVVAAMSLPEAAGTCGPLRKALNLANMSPNLKVHLLCLSRGTEKALCSHCF